MRDIRFWSVEVRPMMLEMSVLLFNGGWGGSMYGSFGSQGGWYGGCGLGSYGGKWCKGACEFGGSKVCWGGGS